jgi:hypothetical protein
MKKVKSKVKILAYGTPGSIIGNDNRGSNRICRAERDAV